MSSTNSTMVLAEFIDVSPLKGCTTLKFVHKHCCVLPAVTFSTCPNAAAALTVLCVCVCVCVYVRIFFLIMNY